MMEKDICTIIRSQVMFYIDNELKEDKRLELLSHLDYCQECQTFFAKESETKVKICNKLKDSYICRCDMNTLKSTIKGKINELISSKF